MGISVNELRIGNLIFGIYEDNNENECEIVCRVLALDETGEMLDYKIWVETFGSKNSAEYFTDFNPIPLTEEWLLLFGFEIKRKNYSLNIGSELFDYAIKDQFVIWKSNNSAVLKIREQGDGWMLKECYERTDSVYKYVHQLQNLFFALTQKELTL